MVKQPDTLKHAYADEMHMRKDTKSGCGQKFPTHLSSHPLAKFLDQRLVHVLPLRHALSISDDDATQELRVKPFKYFEDLIGVHNQLVKVDRSTGAVSM